MISMKRSAVALGAVVLSVSLTACGGGSKAASAPTTASTADFCTAYRSGDAAFAKIGTNDYNAAASAMHDVAGKLKAAGTPADMPADARSGFEVLVNFASKVSADTLKAAADKAKAGASSGTSSSDQVAALLGISSDDAKKIDTFTTWAGTACPAG